MEYTSEKPIKPGFYAIQRKNLDPVICQVWTEDGTDVLMVAFAGRARGRKLNSIDDLFPNSEWSAEPINIDKSITDDDSCHGCDGSCQSDIDEQMIYVEDGENTEDDKDEE